MSLPVHDSEDHAWMRQLEAENNCVIGFGAVYLGKGRKRLTASTVIDGIEYEGRGDTWIGALDSLAYECDWRTSAQIEALEQEREDAAALRSTWRKGEAA